MGQKPQSKQKVLQSESVDDVVGLLSFLVYCDFFFLLLSPSPPFLRFFPFVHSNIHPLRGGRVSFPFFWSGKKKIVYSQYQNSVVEGFVLHLQYVLHLFRV